ncbi:MAG: hypothetical protein KGN78_02610 [Actinomycetales bacterium]|nr:hypothetical protein [Actinomycetales bacterium]
MTGVAAVVVPWVVGAWGGVLSCSRGAGLVGWVSELRVGGNPGVRSWGRVVGGSVTGVAAAVLPCVAGAWGGVPRSSPALAWLLV